MKFALGFLAGVLATAGAVMLPFYLLPDEAHDDAPSTKPLPQAEPSAVEEAERVLKEARHGH